MLWRSVNVRLRVVLIYSLLFILFPGVGGAFENNGERSGFKVLKGVEGALGGMNVVIPPGFAEIVEFDGAPGWEGGRNTSRSRNIRGLGFYVSYPDMKGLENYDLRKEKRESPLDKTKWIFVGLNAGEHFPGVGYIARRVDRLRKSENKSSSPIERYKEIEGVVHGLRVFVPAGLDEKTGKPNRENMYSYDIYLSDVRYAEASIIKCSNRKTIAPPCQHEFSLEPSANVAVYVSYRRQLLPQWREIEMKIRQKIIGFKVGD
jgi:hypothetical protein